MLLGFLLLWVGAVLFVNGMWLLGKIEDREIVVINIISGLIAISVALHDAYGANANALTIRSAAITLMFATTYLWVAYNRISGVDGRGLGWFSLFVAITLIPVSVRAMGAAADGVQMWLAASWLVWAILWFMYFLLLALQQPIQRLTGWATLLTAILTGWLPGFLLLDGVIQAG